MSYDAPYYGSSSRRSGAGGKYDDYDGPNRDRARPRRQASNDRARGTHHDYRVDERTYRRDSYEEPVRPSSYRGSAGGGGGDRREPYYSRRADLYDSDRPSSQDYSLDRRGGDYRPRPIDSQRPKPSKVLGVFGLSTYTTERDLYDIFSSFGHVKEIKMIYDNLTGKSRGFAFVYYESTEDATHAKVRGDQGMEIDGRLVRVDYSLTQAPHPPTPGVYMGKSRRLILYWPPLMHCGCLQPIGLKKLL
ncbi:hypothetical protein AAHC03_020966 [Spirometra sp. Aus1]